MALPVWLSTPETVAGLAAPSRDGRAQPWLPREALCRKLLAQAGAAAVVMLAGPHGVGKSGTLRALGDWLDAAGLPVVRLTAALAADALSALADDAVILVDGLQGLPANESYDDLAVKLVELGKSRLARGGLAVFVSDASPRAPAFRAAWREGMLRLIGPRDLALGPEDCARLLGLPDAAVEGRLAQRLVGGWPLGIKLLAQDMPRSLALLGHAGEKHALPDALQAWFDDIAWPSFSPALQNLLMDLSVMERFGPELAAHLLAGREADDLSQSLRALVQEGFYLRHCPDRPGWLQMMPAFARYVSAPLRLSDPARVERLHHIAITWARQAGEHAEVLRHALQLAPSPEVTALVEASGAISISHGMVPDLNFTQTLRPDLAKDAPLVFFAQIYDRIRHGADVEARIHYEAAAALTEGFTRFNSPQDATLIHGWRTAFDLVFDLALDVTILPERIAALEAQVKATISTHPVLVVSLASVLALLQLDRGDLAQAAATCRLGIGLQQRLRANKVALFLHQHLSSVALAQGSLPLALSESDAATRLAVIEGHADSYEIRTSALHYGLCLFEAGDLERAGALIAPVLPHLHEIHGWIRVYAGAFSAMASIGLAEQGASGAAYWLDQGRALAQLRGWPRLEHMLDVTAQRLGAETASPAQIERFAATSHHCAASAMALAAARIATGDTAGAAAVMADWPDSRLADGDQRHLLQARILTMELAYLRADRPAARQSLAAIRDLAQRAGYVQRLREAGPKIAQVERWLDGAAADPKLGDRHILSPREREIIVHVAAGLVNKEIARILGISEGTVKSHRKHLYEKLGVSSRSEAISKARELGLI